MSVITGVYKSCQLLREDPSAGTVGGVGTTDTKLALISFTMPAFTTSDTGTLAVATNIQNQRRDGKTVTLRSACRGESAYQASSATNFWTTTEAISSGNVTFALTNRTGSAAGSNSATVGLSSGDRPFMLIVAYDAT